MLKRDGFFTRHVSIDKEMPPRPPEVLLLRANAQAHVRDE